jgi:hypothetical protein
MAGRQGFAPRAGSVSEPTADPCHATKKIARTRVTNCGNAERMASLASADADVIASYEGPWVAGLLRNTIFRHSVPSERVIVPFSDSPFSSKRMVAPLGNGHFRA